MNATADQTAALFGLKSGAFGYQGVQYEAINSLVDLPFNQMIECCIIDTITKERRDQSRHCSGKTMLSMQLLLHLSHPRRFLKLSSCCSAAGISGW